MTNPRKHTLTLLALLLTSAAVVTAQDVSCHVKYGPGLKPNQCADHSSKSLSFCRYSKWYCFGCCSTRSCAYNSMWECSKCNAGYRITGNARGDTSFANQDNPSSADYYSCSTCGTGHKCDGSSTRTACGTGRYQDSNAASSCNACLAGGYQDANGQSGCKSCAVGRFGYCSGGSGECKHSTNDCPVCGAGRYQDWEGQTGCKNCDAGRYADNNGNTASTCRGACAAGFYCHAGSSSSQQYPCTPLTSSIADAHTRYCPAGSGAAASVTSGHYTSTSHSNTPAGGNSAFYHDQQTTCNQGQMCVNGVSQNCPLGHYQNQNGQSNCNGKVCSGGYYCDGGATSAAPGVSFECGNARYYCPNAGGSYAKYTVSSNHYTSCDSITNPENEPLSCPQTRR